MKRIYYTILVFLASKSDVRDDKDVVGNLIGASYHLSILTAQVLEFLLHALQRLQEVIIFLR